MACKNTNINNEKRKDLSHMKIICVYSSNITDEPRGLIEINGLYYIEPVVSGTQYTCVTVKINNEFVIDGNA